jgi:hypothetical protein
VEKESQRVQEGLDEEKETVLEEVLALSICRNRNEKKVSFGFLQTSKRFGSAP